MPKLSDPAGAKLSNGLVVCNFSSPHAFEFDDGTLLPACKPDRSEELKCATIEEAEYRDFVDREIGRGPTKVAFCRVNHKLTDPVRRELARLQRMDTVDLIIVPRLLLDAVKEDGHPTVKLVTIRLADRTNKINYHDRFCI